ncbi:hypothetical protein ACFSLT_26025 [Novosphingobium resinovorum]
MGRDRHPADFAARPDGEEPDDRRRSLPAPRNYYHAMHLAVRLQDKVPLADLISHRFSIADAGKALEATRTGIATKAVIDPSIA